MKLFIMRLAYNIMLWLLLPYIFLHLWWRARKQPAYLKHLGERFGRYQVRGKQPLIWLHTVSVGETRAAATLIQRLRETYPHHQILLTHTTPTGRATSEQLYGDDVIRVYLPYDYPFAVRRFLHHFQPSIGILLETEIWFNLVHACHTAQIPLLLLNARLSEKSARGYARFEQLSRNALAQLSAIAAQTNDDAKRIEQLGGENVTITGNLKFDIKPPAAMLELGKQLREQFGKQRKIFLAASTREGEEALLIKALQQHNIPDLLLIIVPRHPQRFSEVATLLQKHDIRFQHRSEQQPIRAETQVVLGDSMGEMFAYYASADLAFIGGSLLPYGGQNLIEACAVGTPVLIGPYTFNFSDATRLAIDAGAAIQIRDAQTLMRQLSSLINNREHLAEMQQQGIAFIQRNRGATNKTLACISQILPPH
jgi:3-deoxy-D-manno-octulosonic-acid transferase